MTKSTEDKRIYADACYAVAVHQHARKNGWQAYLASAFVGTVASLYYENLWFIAVALALGVATGFVLMRSCTRFVTQQTNMPSDTQAVFVKKYKKDRRFARDVDKLIDAADRMGHSGDAVRRRRPAEADLHQSAK